MTSPIIKSENITDNTFISDIELANKLLKQRNRIISQQAEEIAKLRLDLHKLTHWHTADRKPDKHDKYLIINQYGEMLMCGYGANGWAIGGVMRWMERPKKPEEDTNES